MCRGPSLTFEQFNTGLSFTWYDWINDDTYTEEGGVFDLNMEPWDGQDTYGPWQTKTDDDEVHDIDVRIAEAIGYVQSCCMDGEVHVDVPAGSMEKFCPWTDPLVGGPPANCRNSVGGECETNPNANPDEYPISTILRSNLSPALTWCGCTAAGKPTTGYSGRCSYDDNHYTQYTDLATRICNRA